MSRPSSRWALLVSAQQQVPNPFLLCRLVGLQARQLKRRGLAISMVEAIDVALLEAAQGTLAVPEDFETREPKAIRSMRGPEPRLEMCVAP